MAGLLCLLLFVQPSAAQPMVSQVPPDAIIYVGWTAGQGLTERYGNSHLKKLLDASNLPDLFNRFIPEVATKIAANFPEDLPYHQTAMDLAEILLSHPGAFYFQGIDWSDPDQPLPQMGLICDAGDDATRLATLIPEPAREWIRVEQNGTRLSFQVARPTTRPASQPTTRPAQSIRFVKTFTQALEHVHSDPLVIVYIDTPNVTRIIQTALQHAKDPKAEAILAQVLNVTGLGNVRQIIWTGDFDAANWNQRMFIAVPNAASRPSNNGLIELLAGSPVSTDLLKTVPASTSMITLWGLDASGIHDRLYATVGLISPEAQTGIDHVSQVFLKHTGVDLRKDILNSLGSNWLVYQDVNLGGTHPLGTVFVNQLKNPRHLQESLAKLTTALNRWLSDVLTETPLSIQYKTTTLHGTTVHYLATPILSPAWVISKDRLYLAMYPEFAAAAARQAESIKNSLLDNIAFSSLLTHLSPAQDQVLTSIQYVNLADYAPQTYTSWLMLSRLVGFADLFGIDSPLQLIPPLETVMNELSPAARITWTDREGYHAQSVEPFPASRLLTVDLGANAIQIQAMLSAMALPGFQAQKREEFLIETAPPTPTTEQQSGDDE